ncbi:uncharacterized protein LOC135216548 [Macrobrachium nipponense]|uniref:uncharacterized protein LOC135216548 n=1 Tax=Macrobrachium nipponense TaxID=159736 RepID=UPI0030C7FBBA
METLASHVANADSSVQTYAVRITYILLQNPRLSPMVTHRPVHCLILLEGVIKWIMNDHRQDKNVSLALMLTKEIGSFMKSDNDRKASISSVMDHVFLPYVRLCSTSNTEDCENMKKLLFELKQLLSFGLFNETSKEMYMDILSVLFSEETKVTLPADGSQIFSSLIMFINSEPVELCKHLLYEFLTSFAVAYKNCKDMNHRMTIVLCFIIGVSVKGSNILAINKNNLACQQITAQQCSYQKQEALLLSVLVAVKDLHFNHDVTLKSIGPKRWMNNLADLLIKHMLRTASGVQCLQTLLQISPKDVVDLILNNFSPIVKCVSNAVNPDDYDTSKDLASATDDLLCEVLQVYSQLQEAPSMLVNILHSLLKMPKGIGKRTIIPESLYIYDGTLLLPPRFMSQLMKVFSNLVHTNVIATWNVFLTLMTEKFTTLLEESAQYRNFKLVTVAVWLLSCLLRAFPIMEIVSVAGVCENVAQLMIQTARDGIQRLVSIMLTLPHNNDLCGSLLILCHTWGELHIGLCQLDKYVEYPDVSPVQMPEPSQQSADFSYVLPFISSDIWAQISARVVNFGNQPTQLAMGAQAVREATLATLKIWVGGFGRNSAKGQPYILAQDMATLIFPGMKKGSVVDPELAAPLIARIQEANAALTEEGIGKNGSKAGLLGGQGFSLSPSLSSSPTTTSFQGFADRPQLVRPKSLLAISKIKSKKDFKSKQKSLPKRSGTKLATTPPAHNPGAVKPKVTLPPKGSRTKVPKEKAQPSSFDPDTFSDNIMQRMGNMVGDLVQTKFQEMLTQLSTTLEASGQTIQSLSEG